MGLHEVQTDDEDYFKVTADALVKLQWRDIAPAMPCIEKDDSRGKLQVQH